MWPIQLLIIAILLAAPFSIEGVSLLSIMISTPNISTFVGLLNDTGLSQQMNSGSCGQLRCLLVFAPTNDAFRAAYPTGMSAFSIADKRAIVESLYLSKFPGENKGLLANWPQANTPVGADIGFGQVQILQPSNGVLYWPRKQVGSSYMYHVNSARIIVSASDREADNGVFHVLDQMPLPIGQAASLMTFMASSDPAIRRLSVNKSLHYFKEWMDGDTEKSYLYDAFRQNNVFKVRTLFLPSDQAWTVLGNDGLAVLNENLESRRQLLAAHFALNYTLFTGWMSRHTRLNFTCGYSELKEMPAEMYLDASNGASVSAGGVVAKLVSSSVNYPLQDTIIHVIDRPLGFLFKNLATLARDHAEPFYGACTSVPSCRAMLHSNTTNYTLFAPQSIDSVQGLTGTELEQVLNLHFIPNQRLSRPQISESVMLQSAHNAGQIRFRMGINNTNVIVEGQLAGRSYVRAALLKPDVAGTNGMFHLIANPLGQPHSNVQELINSLSQLANASQYLGASGFDPALNSPTKTITAFVPTNAAMHKMRQYRNARNEAIGVQIFSNQNLRNRVLRRILVPNQRIQASALNAGSYQYNTANTVENERLTLTLTGSAASSERSATLSSAGVTVNAHLDQGPYEATNGVLYLTNSVLYRDSDISGYATSAANQHRYHATELTHQLVFVSTLMIMLAVRFFCL